MVKVHVLRTTLLLLLSVSLTGRSFAAQDEIPHAVCGNEDPTPSPTPSPPHTNSSLPVPRPVIIGHRGAPGYLPDHTLEGYLLAIESGVDFIEPDLVSTKDGVLVARHEPNIKDSTDVETHPEFASRRRYATVSGSTQDGFFVSDFTLAELKTLGALQPLSERDQGYNGKFKIATLDEIITLAKTKSRELGRVIGIYPETKHPTYHRDIGLPLEEKLLETLDEAGWNHADAPVIIQSFEQSNLRMLRTRTRVPLAQLVDAGLIDPKTGAQLGGLTPYDWTVAGRDGYYLDMLTPEGLREIASYADIVAPYKRYIVTTIGAKFDATTGRVVDYNNDPTQEYLHFLRLGVDGIFSDNCKTAVPARDLFLKQKK